MFTINFSYVEIMKLKPSHILYNILWVGPSRMAESSKFEKLVWWALVTQCAVARHFHHEVKIYAFRYNLYLLVELLSVCPSLPLGGNRSYCKTKTRFELHRSGGLFSHVSGLSSIFREDWYNYRDIQNKKLAQQSRLSPQLCFFFTYDQTVISRGLNLLFGNVQCFMP